MTSPHRVGLRHIVGISPLGTVESLWRLKVQVWKWMMVALLLPWPIAQAQTSTASGTSPIEAQGTGPIRLRQPAQNANTMSAIEAERRAVVPAPPPYRPGEFETFVRRIQGGDADETRAVRRFGAELMTGLGQPAASEQGMQVPADYAIAAGDELLVTVWGSVDADLVLVVDRSGRISIPRVGVIPVAGVKVSELQALVQQRIAQVFKNFQVSVSVSRVHDIRVYVTGFSQKPGAYTVSGLSTIVGALMRAGGPSSAGSFRNIELRRGGKAVAKFDLYELLLNGNRVADRLLQSDDVLHIASVGPQVALIGSVNRPGIFEMRPTDSVADLIAMAGGFVPVADRSRLAIERLDRRNDVRIVTLQLPDSLSVTPVDGDVLRAFSVVDSTLPVARQNKRVHIEGEVNRPGDYILPPESSLADLVAAAGGLSTSAFIYGAEFTRESVRRTQQDNYDRALRDLETEFNRSQASRRATTADEAAAQASSSTSTTRLIERLRLVKPTGRVVLQTAPEVKDLPPLALEDGDHLYIPPRPTTVGVFGSVFNAGSYLHAAGKTIGEYLRLAGGSTRSADAESAFVIRANGGVVSGQQSEGWFFKNTIDNVPAEPGDTIFVPEEMNKTTFLQAAKEWTQILYQFGLGAAALKTIKQ